MKVIIVDDDESVIEQFRETAESINEVNIVGEFTDPREALEFVEESKSAGAIDLVLSDVVMPHMDEAIDKLWEDREYDSRVKQCYRTAVMQLKITLRKYNAEELFKTKRGSCFIDANLINCDLYDLMDEKEEAIRRFDYVYMMEYSWAEETLGSLFEILG